MKYQWQVRSSIVVKSYTQSLFAVSGTGHQYDFTASQGFPSIDGIPRVGWAVRLMERFCQNCACMWLTPDFNDKSWFLTLTLDPIQKREYVLYLSQNNMKANFLGPWNYYPRAVSSKPLIIGTFFII